MSLSIKRIIIAAVTVLMTAILLGLKTETERVIVTPMAWPIYRLSFYGFPIATGGGLFRPLLEIAAIGLWKYWLCALTLLTGAALFAGAGRKPLAELFNISYYLFLALAAVLTFCCCVAVLLKTHEWDSLLWDLVFNDGYQAILLAFLPAGFFKILKLFCRGVNRKTA